MEAKRIYRYHCFSQGKFFRPFSTKAEIEEWINSKIESCGLDWRAGYLIRFRDRTEFEFKKANGDKIKL